MSFWHDDVTKDIIHMCSRSHDLLGIKGAVHSEGGSVTETGFGPFEVCTGSDVSGASL